MSNEKDFQQRVQRIGALVQEIEAIADPALRASTTQLVQLVMEFHGEGLDRMLEILSKAGDPGIQAIDQLGRDPIISSLLVLHGLHPESLETRVAAAVERLVPKLQRDGAQVELLSIADGAVHIRVTPGEHSCGSTTNALRSTVEDAIYEAAADVASLTIEGLDGKLASGFVALNQLAAAGPVGSNANAPASHAVASYAE
jgi:Fe-S cluster biogenesis protein NfuA